MVSFVELLVYPWYGSRSLSKLNQLSNKIQRVGYVQFQVFASKLLILIDLVEFL